MSWLDDVGVDSGRLQSVWNAAIGVNDGSAYGVGKTSETVPTDAMQSMAPVTAGVTTPGWTQFMQQTLGGLVGYAIQKDAAANGVPTAVQQQAQQQAQQAARPGASFVMPLLIGLGVVVAGVVAYKLVK